MKKELKTEYTKERIMAQAMKEFGSNGYAAASLNQICNEAGIAKGLLYHNYESKDVLYLACVQQTFDKLTAYLKEQEPAPDIQHYMDARLRFFHENEQEARLFFEAVLQPPVILKDKMIEARKEFDVLNQDLYRNMLSSLSLREDVNQEEAMRYFMLMQNMFNGYFSSPALSGLPFSDAVNAHETGLLKMLDFMLYGIAERR